MAESIVKTFKRDYVGRMGLTSAVVVLSRNYPPRSRHHNEVHPHSRQKMRWPCEFKQHLAEPTRRAQLEQPPLHGA